MRTRRQWHGQLTGSDPYHHGVPQLLGQLFVSHHDKKNIEKKEKVTIFLPTTCFYTTSLYK